MKTLLSILLLLFISSGLFSQNQKYSKVKIDLVGKNINDLGKLGIALDDGFLKKNQFIISDLSEKELEKITKKGFNYEILIEDVSKFYADRNKLIPKEQLRKLRSGCGNTGSYKIPANFDYGSMGGYFTLDELMDILDSMRAKFPNLISAKKPVGTQTTVEGRKIYWVKISDNPDVDENEPELLYTAITHAREAEGLSQLIFYMYYLLENYNSNPEIKYIVDNTEMYFLPCQNPDGYVYNETTYPQGGGMWRKNRKNNGDGSFGIDINRNFGYMWCYDDIGSSPVPKDETYRGSAAFSEKETQIIKYFCEQHQFKLAINYHTYSNILITPWAYNAKQSPDSLTYNAFGTLLTESNYYTYGLGNEVLGYGTNGTQDDWMYGEQSTKPRIYSMTTEIGSVYDGFWPATDRIIPLALENLQPNIYLALLTHKFARVKDAGGNFINQLQGYFPYNIQRLGLDTGACTFTVSVEPVSNNIIAIGASKTYSNLNFLSMLNDSLSFTLSPAIQPGNEITYVLIVDNGSFTFRDTITKIYGNDRIVFSDNCSSLSKWISPTWNTTTEASHSGSSSITDSPHSFYDKGTYESITTKSNIDIHSTIFAVLTFWAKWDVQKYTDYVQIQISTDNGTNWQPLCGKYTDYGNYTINEPIYSGVKTGWVQETINLNDYLGQYIKLQFSLFSGTQYWQTDGFYFDDVMVYAIHDSTNSIESLTSSNDKFILYAAVPNPVISEVKLSYNIPANSGKSNLFIYNSLGEIVSTKMLTPDQNAISISLDKLPAGIYFACIRMDDRQTGMQKIVKQ
jgi:carboxypeptidase T